MNKTYTITKGEMMNILTVIVGRCLQKEPVIKNDEQVKDEQGNNLWQFDAQGAVAALELLAKITGVL